LRNCQHQHLQLHEGWWWCLDCETPYGEYLGYIPSGKIVFSEDEDETTATPLDRGHPSVPDWVPAPFVMDRPRIELVEMPANQGILERLEREGTDPAKLPTPPSPIKIVEQYIPPPAMTVEDLFTFLNGIYASVTRNIQDMEVWIYDDEAPSGTTPARSIRIEDGRLVIDG
jgi:hypothetical protein